MPPKAKKNAHLLEVNSNKITISKSQLTITEQNKTINTLEHAIKHKGTKIENLKKELEELNQIQNQIDSKSVVRRKRCLDNPTTDNLKVRTKQRRLAETVSYCSVIHGASKENNSPLLTGLVDTVVSTFKSDVVACKMLSTNSALTKAISKRCEDKFRSSYYKSEENVLRSLNTYYSYNVMGKRKYLSIRQACKAPHIPNFVSYKVLAERIRNVDIGEVLDIHPTLTYELSEDEFGKGKYRNLADFALRLSKFYVKVNKKRIDKLKTFDGIERKNPASLMFLFALGSDEAPGSGTSVLISFLNVGKRSLQQF